MLKDKKIAIIGAGHIGAALAGGMVRANLTRPQYITASRRSAEALAELKKKWGLAVTNDNVKAARGADIVLLAVKPQSARTVLSELKGAVTTEQLVISIMAGIRTETIAQALGAPIAVVRAMPNTPVLIDCGATALACGKDAAPAHLAMAETIFKAVGSVEIVPEALMDAVTGLSGSGPVYIYMLIEALTDGGVKMGLPRATALRLAAQTVFGSARMVLDTGKHPAILKDEVTTPGGTAIAAIHELESKGLRTVLIDAVVTATRRSQELSNQSP
ncbi:MAG: pyrroline-5-carboxylate reductase [Elusimicrobia bacterium]|nr:pyrroline-5-carboxylate reductase [Elusimicrobiota bacterium]